MDFKTVVTVVSMVVAAVSAFIAWQLAAQDEIHEIKAKLVELERRPIGVTGEEVEQLIQAVPQKPILTAAEIVALIDSRRTETSIQAAESLPKSAVVAFDLAAGCPQNWSDVGRNERHSYAGRTLVVAGPRVDRANNQTTIERAHNNQGGQEDVPLRIEEMPRHGHLVKEGGGVLRSVADAQKGIPDNNNVKVGHDFGVDHAARATDAKGRSIPHDNMQPFVALHFCKKL